MAVLREAGALAAPLWSCVRRVAAWAQAPAEAVEAPAPPAGAADPVPLPAEAASLVDALTKELRLGGNAAPERLAGLCADLADWARRAYVPTAAVAFTAAAAAVQPGSPGYARAAGDEYRRAGRHADAATMYERAAVLARSAGDWPRYVEAHAALARVALLRGDTPGARRSFARALRRAEQHGQQHLRAAVLHELFRLTQRAGDWPEAEARAMAAAAAYRAGEPGLCELAGEAVAFWLQEGRHEDAYPVLARLATRQQGALRTRALGSLARSAGALGEEGALRGALQALLALPAVAEARAEALLDAAEGALILGWVAEAETAARAAVGSAVRREEPAWAAAARSLLTRAAARRALGPAAPLRRAQPPRSPLSGVLAAALDRAR